MPQTLLTVLWGLRTVSLRLLDSITSEINKPGRPYDKIKDETLPDLQESISDAQELLSQAFEDVNNQTNAVNNLIQYTEDLLSYSEGLKQLFLVAGAWWMVDTDPEKAIHPRFVDTTTGVTSGPIDLGQLEEHSTGGLIRNPTLLTDIATGRPIGTMAENEAEYIVPTDRMGGITLVQNFDMSGAVIRSDMDIKAIAEEVANESYKEFSARMASKGIKV
jgi:hypothetical protein